MAKRTIFSEIMEGIAAMRAHREGTIPLRSYNVQAAAQIDEGYRSARRGYLLEPHEVRARLDALKKQLRRGNK